MEGACAAMEGRCMVKLRTSWVFIECYKFWGKRSDYEAEIDTDGTVSLK